MRIDVWFGVDADDWRQLVFDPSNDVKPVGTVEIRRNLTDEDDTAEVHGTFELHGATAREVMKLLGFALE